MWEVLPNQRKFSAGDDLTITDRELCFLSWIHFYPDKVAGETTPTLRNSARVGTGVEKSTDDSPA